MNGQYKSDDAIGKLMQDFFEQDPHKMNYSALQERAVLFKETEEGKRAMCKLIEDYAKKWEVEPARKEFAEKLWNKGYRDYGEISELTDLPVGEVKKLLEGKTA